MVSVLEVLEAQWRRAEAIRVQASEVMERARAVAQLSLDQKVLLQILWDLANAHQPDQAGSTCAACGQRWARTTMQLILARFFPAGAGPEAAQRSRAPAPEGPPATTSS